MEGNGSGGMILVSALGDSSIVTNNQIGSPGIDSSIYTDNKGFVTAIATNNGGVWYRITDNRICNILKNATSLINGNELCGISENDGATSNTCKLIIRGNTIFHLSSNAQQDPAVSGINIKNPANRLEISFNSIYGLSGYGTQSKNIYGIYYIGTLNFSGSNRTDINANSIHHLSIRNSTQATIKGIYSLSGPGRCEITNNMVGLGLYEDGTPNSSVYYLFGINGSGPAVGIFHNSIYLGGADSLMNAVDCGVELTDNFAVDSVMNNIIFLDRINPTLYPMQHLAFMLSAQMHSDYNLIFISDVEALFAQNPSATSMHTWQTSGKDIHSFYSIPTFVNPLGDTATWDMHLSSSCDAEGSGFPISWVKYDFDNQNRASLGPVDIGADAVAFQPTGIPSSFTRDKLIVSPNPSSGQTSLQGDFEPSAVIQIRDQTGRLIKSYNVSSLVKEGNRYQLPLEGITPGLYIISVPGKEMYGEMIIAE